MSRRGFSRRGDRTTRVLATVWFTDMVDSTRIAAELGDRRWRVLRAAYHRKARELLRRHGGREVDTAGDGVFATFSDQEQAIRCACAFAEAVHELGVEVRSGVHVGQADRVGRALGGIAVHTGARIMAAAGPAEVVVSGVLRDLVGGSGFEFEDMGVHDLKGVPDRVHLYRVAAVDGAPPAGSLPEADAQARREAIVPPPLLHRGGRRRLVALVAGGLVAVGVAIWAVSASSSKPVRIVAPANAVVVVNSTTGKVVWSVPAGRDPTALLVRSGVVWEADGAQRALIRLDPATGVRKTVRLGVTPTALAPGPLGSVWVAAGLAHKLFEIDGRTGSLYRSLTIPGCCRGPDALTAAGGVLWLADPGGTRRIDPNSRTIGAPADTLGSGGIVADTSGAIWVSDGWNTLRSIDPATRQVSPPLPVNGLGGGPAGPGAMVSTGGALWVAATYAHEVVEINPDQAQVIQPVPLPGTPTAIAATATSVWVATDPGGILSRIDPSGRVTKQIPLGPRVGALALSDGTVVAATEPSRASQRAIGDIAYDANGRILLVHAGSGERRLLTSNSSTSAYPTWSPDGSRLAFVRTSNRGDIGEVPTHVLEMRADGTHVVQVTHGLVEDADPAWSPNGEWIVFVRLSYPGSPTGQLWLVRPDGSRLHQLTHGVAAQTPSWAPDGRSIAFAIAPGGIAQSLAVISVDGAHLHILSSAAAFAGAPAHSPDGVHIAYGSQDGTALTTYHSAASVHLITNPALQAPAWAPDGSQIAVAGVLGDLSRLLIVNADGTGLSPIIGRFGAPASTATTANGADVAWRPHT